MKNVRVATQMVQRRRQVRNFIEENFFFIYFQKSLSAKFKLLAK